MIRTIYMVMGVKQLGVVFISAVLMLSGCGRADKDTDPMHPAQDVATDQDAVEDGEEDTTVTSAPTGDQTAISTSVTMTEEQGLALAQVNGCLACHRIETKLVGPAWRDVGRKYKGVHGAKARLIKKVKTGGKGSWTDVTGGISMPPYSPRVSDKDIEKLVTFVLSL